MERWDKLVAFVAAIAGAAGSYLFGGWSALLGILLTFVVVDYLSGVVAAGLEGKLSSLVGLRGIAKKVSVFVIVAVAHLADTALGSNHVLRDATIFFYLANELISILENAGRIGIPIPSVLAQAVEVLKGRSKGESR